MSFFKQVYEAVKRIPEGNVTTYGDIAKYIGKPQASRTVGWALHSNPEPGIIPCHRVVNKLGALSGNFAFGGYEAQHHLLMVEGVTFNKDGHVIMEKHLFQFS